MSTHMTFLGWGLGVAGLRGNLETPAEGGQRIPPLTPVCSPPDRPPPASPRPAYLQTSCEESPSAASRAASLGPGGPGAQTTTVGRGGDTEVLGRIPFSQPRPSTPGPRTRRPALHVGAGAQPVGRGRGGRGQSRQWPWGGRGMAGCPGRQVEAVGWGRHAPGRKQGWGLGWGGGGGPSEGARRRGEDPGVCDAPSASTSGRSLGSCTTAPRAGSVHMTGPQKARTAPPRAAAYADLGGRDPPAGGPRSDRGGSRVGVRDVGPQGGLGRSRQDFVQFLCTVGGHRLSHQDPEPPVALAASPPREPRPRPAPTVLGEGPGTRGPHPGNTG